MTMRLNLESILKTQLKNHDLMDGDNRGHKLAVPTDREKAALRLGAGKSSALHYFNDKSNVKARIQSMMSSIHKHMKTTVPPRKAVPAIPAPIAEISKTPSVTKSVPTKKSRRMKGGGGINPSNASAMHISHLKARLQQQSQQLMKRGYSDLNPKSYTNQKRIREVMLQKSVLENMLLQHKRLQRDRQNIALDIQKMRQDLDKIKTKLDTSMQTLNSTRTLYSGIVRGKKGLLPIATPIKIAAPSVTATPPAKKKATIGKILSSGGNIKRVPAISKRRSRLRVVPKN